LRPTPAAAPVAAPPPAKVRLAAMSLTQAAPAVTRHHVRRERHHHVSAGTEDWAQYGYISH
jgi:hypothetical protein